MATRKPLVRIGGRNKELPSADTLPVAALQEAVTQTITDGDTTHTPSAKAVHDALHGVETLLWVQREGGSRAASGSDDTLTWMGP